jgi:hypothetical protein
LTCNIPGKRSICCAAVIWLFLLINCYLNSYGNQSKT